MRRFISFRDFDWLLLGLVLLLSVISIFGIYSATLHTKFVGFETKQVFWLSGGLGGDVPLFANQLPPFARVGALGLRVLPDVAGRRPGWSVPRSWEAGDGSSCQAGSTFSLRNG